MKKLLVLAGITVMLMMAVGCGKVETGNVCTEYSYNITIQDGTEWIRYEYHCNTSKEFAKKTAYEWNGVEVSKGNDVSPVWETTDDKGNVYYFFDVAG